MKNLVIVLLCGWILGLTFNPDEEQPTEVILESIPDLLQTVKSAEFKGGGSQFCAPVSVSNSLVWLEGKKNRKHQIEVVKKLSSKAYMNTDLRTGTGTTSLMRGVDRYAREVWAEYHRLEYAGWRPALKGKKVADQPSLAWMTQALHDRGAVWINVGWYKQEHARSGEKNFARVGGHWVTLIGYSKGRLIVHDPAPRAGKASRQEKVEIATLGPGTLTGTKKGLPVPSNGFIRLGKGMHISTRGDTAIIDGAVVFELSPRKK